MSAEGEAVAMTSADEFRAFLDEIGETQSGFARTLIRLGDDRAKGTVLRHVQRMATGEARVSGEMRVIMSIFRHSRRKARQTGTTVAQNGPTLEIQPQR